MSDYLHFNTLQFSRFTLYRVLNLLLLQLKCENFVQLIFKKELNTSPFPQLIMTVSFIIFKSMYFCLLNFYFILQNFIIYFKLLFSRGRCKRPSQIRGSKSQSRKTDTVFRISISDQLSDASGQNSESSDLARTRNRPERKRRESCNRPFEQQQKRFG